MHQKNKMVLRKDFNWTEIRMLIKIKNCPNSKRVTISEIAKYVNTNRNNPQFYKVLNYLVESKIITLVEIVGPVKIFNIDYKKMRDLLDEQDLINELLITYLNKDHIFNW